jgi:Ca-activated chloride channel family protein
VRAQLAGPLAEVEVVQRFRNTSDEEIEATYLFPLPHEAAVHALRFRIGARVIEGKVKENEEARRSYERARAEGRAATLVVDDRNRVALRFQEVTAADVDESLEALRRSGRSPL